VVFTRKDILRKPSGFNFNFSNFPKEFACFHAPTMELLFFQEFR
jgi:hypothetical protein